MAKKRAEAKPVEAVVEVTKPVRLDLPTEAHRMLRLVAAHDGASMASFARDAMIELLKVEMKRRGLKL